MIHLVGWFLIAFVVSFVVSLAAGRWLAQKSAPALPTARAPIGWGRAPSSEGRSPSPAAPRDGRTAHRAGPSVAVFPGLAPGGRGGLSLCSSPTTPREFSWSRPKSPELRAVIEQWSPDDAHLVGVDATDLRAQLAEARLEYLAAEMELDARMKAGLPTDECAQRAGDRLLAYWVLEARIAKADAT